VFATCNEMLVYGSVNFHLIFVVDFVDHVYLKNESYIIFACRLNLTLNYLLVTIYKAFLVFACLINIDPTVLGIVNLK
jgi:hypothetical protein